MKMKNKTKTILLSIAVISLFIGLVNVHANTLYDVFYPSTVFSGESFEIEVYFIYDVYCSCIFGDYVYLFYSINKAYIPTNVEEGSNVLTQTVYSTNPRPESVTFTVDPDNSLYPFDFEDGDIFRFKIQYSVGVELLSGMICIGKEGTILSETQTIIIISVTGTTDSNTTTGPLNLSFAIIFIPLAIIAVVLQITKRGKKP